MGQRSEVREGFSLDAGYSIAGFNTLAPNAVGRAPSPIYSLRAPLSRRSRYDPQHRPKIRRRNYDKAPIFRLL